MPILPKLQRPERFPDPFSDDSVVTAPMNSFEAWVQRAIATASQPRFQQAWSDASPKGSRQRDNFIGVLGALNEEKLIAARDLVAEVGRLDRSLRARYAEALSRCPNPTPEATGLMAFHARTANWQPLTYDKFLGQLMKGHRFADVTASYHPDLGTARSAVHAASAFVALGQPEDAAKVLDNTPGKYFDPWLETLETIYRNGTGAQYRGAFETFARQEHAPHLIPLRRRVYPDRTADSKRLNGIAEFFSVNPTEIDQHAALQNIRMLITNGEAKGLASFDRLFRACIFAQAEQFDACIRVVEEIERTEKAADLEPGRMDPWTIVVEHLERLGNPQLTHKAVSAFLGRAPHLSTQLARHHARQGDLDTALSIIQRHRDEGLVEPQLLQDPAKHVRLVVGASFPDKAGRFSFVKDAAQALKANHTELLQLIAAEWSAYASTRLRATQPETALPERRGISAAGRHRMPVGTPPELDGLSGPSGPSGLSGLTSLA